MRVIYFGCPPNDIGHYYQDEHGKNSYLEKVSPWGYAIDGRLAPRTGEDRRRPEAAQGVIAVHRKDGWTALAWWDRSMDKRGASNSAFLFESPDIDPVAALSLGREHFPWVFERMKFELVLPAAQL